MLDAAQALLHEVGYSKITIDQISARAGVSKATVYRWWPNKAAVFMELYLELTRLEAKLPTDTGSLEGDLREQIRRAFRLFRKTVAGQALAGFVADAQVHTQTARALRGAFADDRRALNLGMLERARERGELSAEISLEVAAEIITGAVYYGAGPASAGLGCGRRPDRRRDPERAQGAVGKHRSPGQYPG